MILEFLKKHDVFLAGIIISIIILLVYMPVTIFEYTNNPSYFDFTANYDLDTYYDCKEIECPTPENITIDPAAAGHQDFPIIKLATILIKKGIIPLWNPYLATGTPLAADTINTTFSPLTLLYFLPDIYWDVSILAGPALAGFFIFLFLKCWKLGFVSRISASVFFMLSGPFTWWLPHNSIPVIVFTPLVLFAIEKIIQKKDPKYIILASVAFTFSILGAHVESIILLLLFVVFYLVLRIIFLHYSRSKYSRNFVNIEKNNINTKVQSLKKISLKSVVSFFGGLGLASFFILPVYEFFYNMSPISHGSGTGLVPVAIVTSVTAFVPYFLGTVHNYVLPATVELNFWPIMGGYVGSLCLLFSLFGIFYSRRLPSTNSEKYIPQIFFIIAIIFYLKSLGAPVINWLGYIPLYDLTLFSRYDGFIWSFSFAVAAAFGIEVIRQGYFKRKDVGIISAISISTIILLSLFALQYFPSENLEVTPFSQNYSSELQKFGITANPNDLISYYMVFQVFQAIIFILIISIMLLSSKSYKQLTIGITLLIIIELSIYIPLGLDYVSLMYRSLIALIGFVLIGALFLIPFNRCKLENHKNLKLIIIIGIFVATLIGEQVVYLQSSIGLPLKQDVFASKPLTNFLKTNLDNSRIFSFDTIFPPNFPAAHEIQTIGILSAFNTDTFYSFVHTILDPWARITVYDYHVNWRLENSPSMENTFKSSKPFLDFLGVKYLLASTVEPNFYTQNNHIWIPELENSLVQEFQLKTDSLSSINIQLTKLTEKNYGNIVLKLDSIPPETEYHRESIINVEDIISGTHSIFEFEPITNVYGKNFSFSLIFLDMTLENVVGVAIHDSMRYSEPPVDVIIEEVGGNLILSGKEYEGVAAFSINNIEYPLVFHDDIVRVYENIDAFPKSFLIYEYEIADSYIEAQEKIKNLNFDLSKKIILEKELPFEQAQSLNLEGMEENILKITQYDADKISISTQTTSASLLVVTDTHYPGWKAFVDGEETPIYRTNGLVRSIFLPSGTHNVEFSYFPESFSTGLVISTITAISLLVIFLVNRNPKFFTMNQTSK